MPGAALSTAPLSLQRRDLSVPLARRVAWREVSAPTLGVCGRHCQELEGAAGPLRIQRLKKGQKSRRAEAPGATEPPEIDVQSFKYTKSNFQTLS